MPAVIGNLVAAGAGRVGAFSRARAARLIAQFGVFSYLLGFTIDWNVNFLLMWLALCSVAAVLLSFGEDTHRTRSPILYLVGLFLAVAALSIMLSEDVSRSLRLSAPLLPAVLLFFPIHEYFDDARDLFQLYVCLTMVALGLSIALLWTALTAGVWYPFRSPRSQQGSVAVPRARDPAPDRRAQAEAAAARSMSPGSNEATATQQAKCVHDRPGSAWVGHLSGGDDYV